jgi:site-specific recombinase XerC
VLDDLLQDQVAKMEQDGLSRGYINEILKAVRSWLNYSVIDMKRKINIANRDVTPTLHNDTAPKLEELHTILMHT